jgi:hypothetical protein
MQLSMIMKVEDEEMANDVNRFRLKPDVEIEAVQLRLSNVDWVAVWCDGLEVESVIAVDVPTDSGIARATDGDWVVKSPGGSFYVWDPEEFDSMCEKVDS